MTPPGVADKAGLVVAGASDGTLTVGFVPGQRLRFTPLAISKDDGAHWSQGLLPAGLVAAPSALAALPGGRLLAITAGGAEESGPAGTGWTSLITLHVLAATSAGRSCGLTRLTAAAASPSGAPLLAGDCSRPGAVGIFEQTASGWQIARRVQHGSPARQPIGVLQMVSAGSVTSIILSTGAGRHRQAYADWLAGRAAGWRPDLTLRVGTGRVGSTAVSAAGDLVVVSGARQGMFDGVPEPTGAFNNMPIDPPASGAALALERGLTAITALVPGTSSIAIWERGKSGKWHRTQSIEVPAELGAS